MRRVTIGAMAVSLVICSTIVTRGQGTLVWEGLTVPQNLLPAGCDLPASDVISLGGNRIRGGLWAGLPISNNPWHGSDRNVLAVIRERVAASPLVADGPPLTGKAVARFRLQTAEDVAEAYAAVYRDEADTIGTVVYAARFTRTPVPELPRGARAAERLVRGDLVVVISGSGPCSGAVTAYVKEFMAR